MTGITVLEGNQYLVIYLRGEEHAPFLACHRACQSRPVARQISILVLWEPWKHDLHAAQLFRVLKIGDLVYRGAYTTLLDGSAQSMAFLVEVGLGVVVPWCMLVSPTVRRSRRALFSASLMIVLGVVLNRINAFITGFTPPHADTRYVPSVGELLVTAGAIATIFFLYRLIVSHLPVLSAPEQEASAP